MQRKIVYTKTARDQRHRSARGDAARESVSEFVARPWKSYFDDVETVPMPSALLNPTKVGVNSSRTQSLDDGKGRKRRPSMPKTTVAKSTGGQSAIGPYLQTTTRQLTAERAADVDLYALGADKGVYTSTVLFPFKARSERELSVKKDDLVTIISVVDEKWVECEAKSRRGLLPQKLTNIKLLFCIG